MRFVVKFEAMCRMINDEVITLGLFDSYDEASDAAIMQASVALPNECMKAFQINKVYINVPVFTTENVQKGG